MRKGSGLLLFGLLVAAASTATAQVQYSVGNYTRYGNGTQIVGGESQFKEYFENQTNVRLFWNDFTVGFQYLYDDPPEFGPNWQGIRKRYVEYARDGIELRAGDFFTLYGKGLAMNLFENRGINYDTGLDGLRGIYRNEYVTGIAAAGTMRFYDLVNSNRIETYSVKSAHAELTPRDWVRVGGSIVSATGELPSTFGIDNVKADILEGMITLKGFGFEAFASYAHKDSRAARPQVGGNLAMLERDGDGIYGSLSYTSDIGLGVTFEYKDYRFDPVDPDERTDVNRPTRMLPMQNPPIVHKEHSFYLLSRNPHVIDFNDEKGMQLDVFYSVTPEITINLNGSVASRQRVYVPKSGGGFTSTQADLGTLLSLDEKYSPFHELYADVEWYFDGQSYVRAAFNYRNESPYLEYTKKAKQQSSTTIPVMVEYMLDEEWSVTGQVEYQQYHDSTVPTKPDWDNVYVALTLSKSPSIAGTIRMEATGDETDPSGKQFWIAGEVAYRIKNTHTLTLSYGSERGGLVCSSGICRVVNPFNGVRASLLTQL